MYVCFNEWRSNRVLVRLGLIGCLLLDCMYVCMYVNTSCKLFFIVVVVVVAVVVVSCSISSRSSSSSGGSS